LRYYEHVVSTNRALARLQRIADGTVWPRAFGGCRTACDTHRSIVLAGFRVEHEQPCWLPEAPLYLPTAPRILGCARVPE
jgi:hypothetical protein